MELVALVSILALLQVMRFQWRVGRGRNTFNIPGPATSGHPIWERYNRVHLNTVENLIVFLPFLWLFAYYASPRVAALLGLSFIVARSVYARAYVKEPASRGTGAWLTGIVLFLLAVGSLLGVFRVVLAKL